MTVINHNYSVTNIKENSQDVFIFPTSFGQKRLWFLEQFEPGNSIYNESGAINCRGKLNTIALEQSLNEIIRRHEVLRTQFTTVKGEPVQVVLPSLTIKLPVIDLRSKSETEREAKVKQLIAQATEKPFDLTKAPLMRFSLLQLTENEYIFILVLHHIIHDGWSMGLIFREIEALYKAFSDRQPSPLPDLPIQYADFTIHQNEWLQGEVLEKLLNYWQQQLNNLSVLALPTTRSRPTTETYRGATKSLLLPKKLCDDIKTLSQQQGVTLFMTLLAAFKTLLYRYTQQEDIAVGTPIAGRNLTQTENLIGFFVNTLVLRTQLKGNPNFLELLTQVREVALGAYAHQDMPFEKLVELLKPDRNLGRSPLFQVMFVLQNSLFSEIKLPGVTLAPRPIDKNISKFDLTLSMEEISPQGFCSLENNTGLLDKNQWGMVATFEYNTDLFDTETIERMTEHFQTLLAGIVADPNCPISELPLLTEAESHQLLVEWNDTKVDYPKDRCIHQLFEEQVEKTPDAVALIFEQEQLTYQQLNAQANQLAHYLQSLGVKPEILVGICLERSLEMVVGLLAILKAGGAYVPIDPSYPKERLAYMLEDAAVPVLLTTDSILDCLPENSSQAVCLDHLGEAIADRSQANPVSEVTTENLAYVIYTSGSTGKPKGAMNTHAGIYNRLLWMQDTYQLTATDRILQKTPFSFDVSVWEFFWPLLAGAGLVVAPPGLHKDSAALVKLIIQQQITTIHFVPSMLNVFLQAPNIEKCCSLKRIICSGEALSDRLQARCQNRLKCELHNLYGPTEAAIDVTFWNCSEEKYPGIVPIGRPIANTQIYILDKNHQPVPIGVAGELHIGGVGLARGYLNRPELTAEKFIIWKESGVRSQESGVRKEEELTSQKLEGKRLYKTGDLARYLPDGNIEYLGRIDNQVKMRGFRIELGEIESVLSSHPQIQQTVVICREDSPVNKRLIAYLVSSEPGLNSSELRPYLQSKLPEYMVPSAFVWLETLPLTPNGKIDRKALPAPDIDLTNTDEYIPPQTPTQEIIANIFAEVLAVTKVGINDNFFALGGHSLLATQVLSRIRESLTVEIPLKTLFESPTVARLDKSLKKLTQNSTQPQIQAIQPIPRNGKQLPLSWAQERLWFLQQLEAESATYNELGALRITGNFNNDALKFALAEIVRRHEILRTRFEAIDGTPIQVVEPEINLVVQINDWQHLSPTQQETDLQKYAQQEINKPFNLTTGPLLRVILLQLSATESILLVTIHHIICDGWSLGVFIKELSILYTAYSQGEASPLTDLPIQYADFSVWQRRWLSGEVNQIQLNYWKQQLAAAPTRLQLPTDRPRPRVQSYRGARQTFRLSPQLTQQLQQLSRVVGTTLSMTLEAAFATLLYRYSSQSDISIGSPIANRNRSEIEPLIGFFVNTLVLRTKFADNPTFEELLTQVRQVSLEAYAHQDVPFEQVVEALQPERNLSHSPLFQVMFGLQNAPKTSWELPGVKLTPLTVETTMARFDLTLFMEETKSGLVGSWEYATDLFDRQTISRMTGHFETLLAAIVENPQQRVAQLPLLTEAESHQLLVEWNDTAVDYPKEKCIHQLLEEQVEKTPDAIAVVFEQEQLTYQQLNAQANQLAHYLQSLGVGPEVLVGICVKRSVEMLVGLLAILKAGGAYVPMDPSYPQERLAYMLADAEVPVLLTNESVLESLPANLTQVVCLDNLGETIANQSTENPTNSLTPENLAYVIYTSGSTGKPKGVQICHQSVVNFLVSMNSYLGLTAKDTFSAITTISFDIAALELYLPLMVGAKLAIVAREIAIDGNQLLPYLQKSPTTVVQATPATWQMLLTAGLSKSNLGIKILCGGEALSGQLARQLQSSGSELWNLYGPTEATIWSSIYFVGDDSKLAENANVTAPIGRPIANTQIYILDSYGQPVPVGVPGELHIGGDGLARGYRNRPELTAEKFICVEGNSIPPNPPLKGGKIGKRLYKTGDLARYLPDGNIEYLGRIDNQVKMRGFRIELGEIESVLSTHPQIQQTAVICREDIPGNKRLVAYYVSSEESLNSQELRSYLQSKLPEYMVPSAFVLLETLPLTPNGKIDRKALPAPDINLTRSHEYVPPQTETEKRIAKVLQEVLQLEKVSIYDNFFELGANSLILVKINSKLREILSIELPVIDMFSYPNIKTLSQHITQVDTSKSFSAEQVLNRKQVKSNMKKRCQLRQNK